MRAWAAGRDFEFGLWAWWTVGYLAQRGYFELSTVAVACILFPGSLIRAYLGQRAALDSISLAHTLTLMLALIFVVCVTSYSLTPVVICVMMESAICRAPMYIWRYNTYTPHPISTMTRMDHITYFMAGRTAGQLFWGFTMMLAYSLNFNRGTHVLILVLSLFHIPMLYTNPTYKRTLHAIHLVWAVFVALICVMTAVDGWQILDDKDAFVIITLIECLVVRIPLHIVALMQDYRIVC